MVKQSLQPDIPVALGTETDARYIASVLSNFSFERFYSTHLKPVCKDQHVEPSKWLKYFSGFFFFSFEKA